MLPFVRRKSDFLVQCTLAFLESYISTASFLHRQTMPNYQILLRTMLPVTSFIGFACTAIFQNPSTSMFCWFLQIPGSLVSNVEEKNCVIVVDGYVSLSIATWAPRASVVNLWANIRNLAGDLHFSYSWCPLLLWFIHPHRRKGSCFHWRAEKRIA